MFDDENNLTYVVIAAAGKGTRMGTNVNKQYLELSGEPVLAWTVRRFENCRLVNGIVIVVGKDEIEFCKTHIVERYAFKKVKAVVAGGATRQQSVLSGLRRVSACCETVLVHDGARPFVDAKCIETCINVAKKWGAAVAAVPAKDTIKRIGSDGFIDETIDRSGLWYIQTPQGFKYDLIADAHRKAIEDGFDGTDDAILLERIGHKVRVVMGSYYNIKITSKEDLVIAQSIAKMIPD